MCFAHGASSQCSLRTRLRSPRRPTEATDVFSIEMSPRSHSPTPTDSSFGESLGESDVVVVALDVDAQSARSESPPLEPSPSTPPTSPLQKLMKSVSNSVLGKNSWAKTQASPAAQHARRHANGEASKRHFQHAAQRPSETF